jgi:hypothetical protein
MATIRELKSGKFDVQVRRTGQPPVSDTFNTMPEARKWARKIEGVRTSENSRQSSFAIRLDGTSGRASSKGCSGDGVTERHMVPPAVVGGRGGLSLPSDQTAVSRAASTPERDGSVPALRVLILAIDSSGCRFC